MDTIFTMPDGSVPWSLDEWFLQCIEWVYGGYSLADGFGFEWRWFLYTGKDVAGDHSFAFFEPGNRDILAI